MEVSFAGSTGGGGGGGEEDEGFVFPSQMASSSSGFREYLVDNCWI